MPARSKVMLSSEWRDLGYRAPRHQRPGVGNTYCSSSAISGELEGMHQLIVSGEGGSRLPGMGSWALSLFC